MARRRGKKHYGRKGGKAIPILPILSVAVPFMQANPKSLDAGLPKRVLYRFTGFDADANSWDSSQAIKTGTLVLLGFVGHKVANKTVNKYVRKATMGYLAL